MIPNSLIISRKGPKQKVTGPHRKHSFYFFTAFNVLARSTNPRSLFRKKRDENKGKANLANSAYLISVENALP